MKMKFTNLHHHENQIRLHQMWRTWIDGSTNPRWKLDRFSLLNFFIAYQNATGYMQDQCYHLQAYGAPITEEKVKRKMLRGIRTQILTLRSTSCAPTRSKQLFHHKMSSNLWQISNSLSSQIPITAVTVNHRLELMWIVVQNVKHLRNVQTSLGLREMALRAKQLLARATFLLIFLLLLRL